jgi:hypothetical protein
MTLQQLINQALFLIGAVESGQDATAAESADMLRALNQMLTMWAKEDKDLKYPPQDTLSDNYPLPLWTEDPVVYNLAVKGATLFNLPVPPDVAFIASEGQKFIAKTLINNNLEQKDMSHMPAGGGRWNIVTDSIR